MELREGGHREGRENIRVSQRNQDFDDDGVQDWVLSKLGFQDAQPRLFRRRSRRKSGVMHADKPTRENRMIVAGSGITVTVPSV